MLGKSVLMLEEFEGSVITRWRKAQNGCFHRILVSFPQEFIFHFGVGTCATRTSVSPYLRPIFRTFAAPFLASPDALEVIVVTHLLTDR